MKLLTACMLFVASLPLVAAQTSCGERPPQEASAVGTLQLRLTGLSSSGIVYRLRHASFEITGTSAATLSSEADPDSSSLREDLPAGPYQALLTEGWFLERQASDGTFTQVKAELTSANPAAFHIVAQQTSKVKFGFKAGDDIIDLGDGTVEIGIEVDDNSAECTPDVWRQIATLPTSPVRPIRVEGVQRIDSDPHTLIVATQNEGSECGGGTPAAIWKLELDPTTEVATSVRFQQSLDLIQTTRRALFESSDGTLLTAGGWCGPTPPYYSTDHGTSFLPATGGDYPPNSSFAFAQFNDDVYVGTGYRPYPGSVYRYTGVGSWVNVFSFPAPYNIIQAMATHQDQLFVGGTIYEDTTACQTASPVYASSDGVTFTPTHWPPCSSVIAMASTGERFLAVAYSGDEGPSVYDWDPPTQSWSVLAPYPFDGPSLAYNLLATHGDAFYAAGVLKGSSSGGIYRSTDGASWTPVVELPGLRLDTITIEGDTLYAAETPSSGGVKVYSLALCD